MHISKAARSIEVAATKKIELIARAQPGTISLAQGIPSFFTAKHIKDAAKRAMDQNLTDKYTTGMGILELRQALAKKIKRNNGFAADSSEIIVTHGGIEALMAIFVAILNPDDDIIILTPDYASHITQVQIVTGGRGPIEVPLVEKDNDWHLDSSRLEKAITKKTRAILFCDPCNPTGKVYSKDELKEIGRIAKKHNLYLISDEMYEYFVFDNKKHISMASFPEVANQVISVFGLSKSYAMTGWRVGYIHAKKPLLDEIFKIHDSMVTCATAVAQYAALAAITGPQHNVQEYKEAFLRRRQMVIDALAKTDKLTLTVPQGAYYAFPKFAKKVDDNGFALRAIKEGKVAVIPGSPFGKGGQNHIRISFGATEDILQEGLKRLVNYINKNL